MTNTNETKTLPADVLQARNNSWKTIAANLLDGVTSDEVVEGDEVEMAEAMANLAGMTETAVKDLQRAITLNEADSLEEAEAAWEQSLESGLFKGLVALIMEAAEVRKVAKWILQAPEGLEVVVDFQDIWTEATRGYFETADALVDRLLDDEPMRAESIWSNR